MANGDALEFMKKAHKRSIESMRSTEGCSQQGHTAVVDGIEQSYSDSEIIYSALQDIPDQVLDKLNGQAKAFQKPAPQATIADKNATKVELGKFKLTTNNVEVATAFMRVLMVGAIVAAVFYGVNEWQDLKAHLMNRTVVEPAGEQHE